MSKKYFIAVSAAVYFLLIYYYPFSAQTPNPNELVRFYMAHSVAQRGELTINKELSRFGDSMDKALVKGKYYSDKAPMQSVLSIAPVAAYLWIFKGQDMPYPAVFVARCFVHAMLGVLLFWLIFSFAFEFLKDRNLSLFFSGAAIFGTPLSTFFILYFSHSVSAALLFSFFMLVYKSDGEASPLRMLLTGLLGGTAFLTEFPLALPLTVLSIYLLFRLERKSRYIFFIIGGSIMAAAFFTYNTVIFGGPFSLSYSNEATAAFANAHKKGLYGITTPSFDALISFMFSLRIGIVTLCPFLLFALAGTVWSVWKRFWPGVIMALCFILHALMIASFDYWDGGVSFGARHLVPVLPFAAALAAIGLKRMLDWKPESMLFIFCALAMYSILIHSVGNAVYPYMSERYLNPFANMITVHLFEGYFPDKALPVFLGLSDWTSFIVWLALILSLAAYLLSKAFKSPALVLSAYFIAGTMIVLLLTPYNGKTNEVEHSYFVMNRMTDKPAIEYKRMMFEGKISIKTGTSASK